MNKRKIRSVINFFFALICGILYVPHLICGYGNTLVYSDLRRIEYQIGLKLPVIFQLLYHLHNNKYYRTLFYHRIGPIKSALMQWYVPKDRYFNISVTTPIGSGMWIAHPYATVINAESIGDGFRCIHCTTIGATSKGRPTLGDNVSLGANVTIIGNLRIGNNVRIGAGSVVVKDLPDNCVAVGNPARVIKRVEPLN